MTGTGRSDRAKRILARIRVFAVAAVLVAEGCSSPVASDPGGGSEPAVRRGEFVRVVLLSGELEAVTGHPVLVPRLPSWQVPIRWLVDDGVHVKAGDPVAELDSSEVASQLDSRRVALDKARNELARKRAEIAGQLAEKVHAEDKAAIALRRAEIAAAVPQELQARRNWQEAQLALDKARTALAKAESDRAALETAAESDLAVQRIAVDRALRDVEEAERAMTDMVLRAPRSGIVVVAENPREGRKFQVGDTAWAGLELVRVPELDRMKVLADLSDVDDGLLEPGQSARCTLDSYPERTFECVVKKIRPVAREAGYRSTRRAFDVEVDVVEADESLMRPGMSVKVEIELDRRPDVRLIARRALAFDDDGSVRRIDGGPARPVRIGACNAYDCVLLDGAEAGLAGDGGAR